MSLTYAPILHELVIRVAKVVCEANGIDPDGFVEIPVGMSEDNQYTTDQEPNYERFVQDTEQAIGALFDELDAEELTKFYQMWKDYEKAQDALVESVDNASIAQETTDDEERRD